MKMNEDLKKAQAQMKAGVITVEGFLGFDDRDIATIIQHDEEEMARLKLNWDEVAAKMHELLKKGSDGLGEPTTVDKLWLIRVDETRGTLPSPWVGEGIFHKVNCEVRRLNKEGKPEGKILLYNELSLHMFEKHHFLQGRGSHFRLEPADIKTVLGMWD
ncbi:MAG: hypothetical protein WCG80_03590 [Spirochaetales bacterium]